MLKRVPDATSQQCSNNLIPPVQLAGAAGRAREGCSDNVVSIQNHANSKVNAAKKMIAQIFHCALQDRELSGLHKGTKSELQPPRA